MYVTEYKHKEYGWQITKDGRFIPLGDIDMNFSDAYESMRLKFSSGNKIPVERATITIDEWDAIIQNLEMWRKQSLMSDYFELEKPTTGY